MSEVVDLKITRGDRRLVGHLAVPAQTAESSVRAGVVICHGLPQLNPQTSPGSSYEFVSRRIADVLGIEVAAVNLSGTGGSEGYFSINNWVDDVINTADELREGHGVERCWLIGVATGGSIALCAAARNPGIAGVVTLAARADFDDWAAHPRRFLDYCRRIGVISDRAAPAAVDAWSQQFKANQPYDAARRLGNRPLMLIHGDDDRQVPVADAERLAAAHGAAELRLVSAAKHSLRHDPRVVALILGWLDRQRTEGALDS